MFKNSMKQKMLAGEQVIGAELGLGCPVIGEIFSLSGYDFVQVDCQHGIWDDEGAFQAFHHILLGEATPSVRVPFNDYGDIGRMLDRGAQSIIVPMVNSREEAQEAARSTRYPPLGARSKGGSAGRLTYGNDYATVANEEILLMVQIETKEAVEQAEAILSVEGVDGCMIGPGDLALTSNWNLQSEDDKKKHRDAILHVKSVAESCGKLPGIATGVEGAEEYLKDGFLFVLCMSDGWLLSSESPEIYESLSKFRVKAKS
jgi:4-hydroxy-2-oxoheptanedioate aldolase